MRGPNTNRLESFGSVGKAFGKPVQVGRLARHLLGLLASDLCAAANRKWVLGIGVVIRVVVVRPLDVEAEVDDGPVLPADVLGVRRVPAALGGFARQRQRLPAEALIAGGEELPLVSAARSGRNRTASPGRTVPSSPSSRCRRGPRPVGGRAYRSWRSPSCRGCRCRPVAARLQVAVEDRERDVAVVDVCEQARVLRAPEGVVGHVAEEPERTAVGYGVATRA
jgi:hypothetical protein